MKEFLQNIQMWLRIESKLAYIVSFEEQRVERILKQLAQESNLAFIPWTKTTGFNRSAEMSPKESLDYILKDNKPGLYLLKDFHPYLKDPSVIRQIRDMDEYTFPQRKKVVFLSPLYQWVEELEKIVQVFDVPLPDSTEIGFILNQLSQRTQKKIDKTLFDKLVITAKGLTEGEVHVVFEKIFTDPAISEASLTIVVNEKKQIIRKTEILTYFDSADHLDHVGGASELKKWLTHRTGAFSEDAKAFGLPEPKGLLLLGVQGCGKSLIAKTIGNLWRLPMVRLDMGMLFSSKATPEGNILKAIKIAEAMSPIILWIDEIDKGFAGLGGGGGESTSLNRVFGIFLTWLQEKTAAVFVVTTANSIDHLPPELLRKGRFDEIFFIDLPDVHEREEIIRIHLKKRKRSPLAFDVAKLAEMTEHFNGAELEQAIISALYVAFNRQEELSTELILKEISKTIPLYDTYEEKIKALRDWAQTRARWASKDRSILDFFTPAEK